jgi:adenine methyltransferase, putative|nr:MAG TPA: adenine-specific methyltransferase [Caudoviricetes sp.]
MGKILRNEVWKLGNHRLMCGDSTIVADIEHLMDGRIADMVFTDPPYGINFRSNQRVKSEKFDVIQNDDVILPFIELLPRFCSGFVFIFTTWKVLQLWISEFTKYFKMTNMIVWYKAKGGMGDLKHTFSTDYEVALVANQGKEIIGKRSGSVWRHATDESGRYIHPTQKPKSLARQAILQTTNEGELVLDLFGGSGTTLIAAEQTNRVCYMMEIDEEYCENIIRRWELFTKKKAIKCI